jgi:hypothetical protein
MGDHHSRGENVTSVITSRLDGFLPEREDGEVERNAKRIFDVASIGDASLQLLRYAVFLSSNNLLFDAQMDNLLKWMIKTDQSFLIERLIKIKMPTVEIFLSHLLVSATRLQEVEYGAYHSRSWSRCQYTSRLTGPKLLRCIMQQSERDLYLVQNFAKRWGKSKCKLCVWPDEVSPLQAAVQSLCGWGEEQSPIGSNVTRCRW